MKRLDKIVSFVGENKIVADIGSDHGITAIKIYEEKNPKKVIATDISAPSLQKLKDKLKYSEYEIETIVTDGLKNLPMDIEEAVISGMGANLIVNILRGNLDLSRSLEKIITSPNNSLEYYRRWLMDNGFTIINDEKIEDEGVLYDVVVIKYTGENTSYNSEYEYMYGKDNLANKNPYTIKEIEQEIARNHGILEKFSGIDSARITDRIEELKVKNQKLEELLCELKN